MIMSAVDVDLSPKKVPVFTLSHVWQHLKLSAFSLGVCLQYGQVADEDVKKPTNQPTTRGASASNSIHYCIEIFLF